MKNYQMIKNYQEIKETHNEKRFGHLKTCFAFVALCKHLERHDRVLFEFYQNDSMYGYIYPINIGSLISSAIRSNQPKQTKLGQLKGKLDGTLETLMCDYHLSPSVAEVHGLITIYHSHKVCSMYLAYEEDKLTFLFIRSGSYVMREVPIELVDELLEDLELAKDFSY